MCRALWLQSPTAEEIEAQLSGQTLTAVVFFLDETFEEVTYGMSTTVADAVIQLAGLIHLTNFETFTLFDSHKARRPFPWPLADLTSSSELHSAALVMSEGAQVTEPEITSRDRESLLHTGLDMPQARQTKPWNIMVTRAG